MTSRQVRVLRGVAAPLFAVFTAMVFHASAGGAVPSGAGLLLTLAIAVPPSILLARRRPSLWRLTASVVVSQLVFHVLFTMTSEHSHLIVHAGHHTEHITVVAGPGAAMDMSASPLMWAAHAAAALVTIVALRHGERMARAILGLAIRFAVRLIQAVVVVPEGEPAAAVPAPRLTLRDVAERIGRLRHRGPPLLLAR